MLEYLSSEYDEVIILRAYARDGKSFMEFFANPKTQTWSILATEQGNPMSCLKASGQAYGIIIPEETPDDPFVETNP